MVSGLRCSDLGEALGEGGSQLNYNSESHVIATSIVPVLGVRYAANFNLHLCTLTTKVVLISVVLMFCLP